MIFKFPDGAGCASIGGVTYTPDKKGLATLPDSCIDQAIQMGLVPAAAGDTAGDVFVAAQTKAQEVAAAQQETSKALDAEAQSFAQIDAVVRKLEHGEPLN